MRLSPKRDCSAKRANVRVALEVCKHLLTYSPTMRPPSPLLALTASTKYGNAHVRVREALCTNASVHIRETPSQNGPRYVQERPALNFVQDVCHQFLTLHVGPDQPDPRPTVILTTTPWVLGGLRSAGVVTRLRRVFWRRFLQKNARRPKGPP